MTIARRFALPLAASLSVLALAACGQGKDAADEPASTESAAPDAKPGMSATDGKMLLPAVAGNPGGVYFTLENKGSAPVSVAAIAITGVEKTEIHQTSGGKMSAVERVDVEPGAVVKFERGGLHVMAFGIDAGLKSGATTEMTITFSDGDKVSTPLALEAMGAMGPMGH